MNVTVLANPKCEHTHRISETVAEVNRLQNYFRLTVELVEWLPNDETEERKNRLDSNKVHQVIARNCKGSFVIAVTQSWIAKDFVFVDERRSASLITVARWESTYAPPPLKIYLMYQFATALLNFAADLSDERIENWLHTKPKGCVFDWWADRRELKRCMIAANVCGKCEVKLAESNLPDAGLSGVEQLLNYIRNATIRRPRTTASDVFIGHGHDPVWETVMEFVKGFGLGVQEFNQESAAGMATTERIQAMLDKSAFAILVMTGENSRGDKPIYARDNVIHEIGLFQGKLGFHRAIVLKARGVPDFSNIHGLTYISLPEGKFAKSARQSLKGVLRREGLVGDDVSTKKRRVHTKKRVRKTAKATVAQRQ